MIRHTAHIGLMIFFYLAQTAINLVKLPFVIARLIKHVLTHDGFDPDFDMLRDRFLIPVADEAAFPSDMTRAAPALRLAAQRDWEALLRLLKGWEACRSTSPTLSDMTTLSISLIADQGVTLMRDPRPEDGVDYITAMERAFAERPSDHMMASVLATLHTRLGWSWRGDGMPDEMSPKALRAFYDHFARAADILAPFDAVTLGAPSVAAARYGLYACHDDADAQIEDWFYDWVDLTPDATTAFDAHGFQLLPQWFGDDETALDRAGLHAVSATSDRLGAAAYPALWMAAYEGICTDDVWAAMDVDLFYQGLDDMIDRTRDPRRANKVTRDLYEMAFCSFAFDASSGDRATIDRLRAGYGPFVRRNLTTLVEQMWDSADEARWYAAQAYRSELEAGATIRFNDGHAQIEMPQETSAPS